MSKSKCIDKVAINTMLLDVAMETPLLKTLHIPLHGPSPLHGTQEWLQELLDQRVALLKAAAAGAMPAVAKNGEKH